VERQPGRISPASIERSVRVDEVRWNPKSAVGTFRGGRKAAEEFESLTWFRAEQIVEGVRNPEDERCWRVEPLGHTDARSCRALKGQGTPGEVHSPCAGRCGCRVDVKLRGER